MRAYLAAKGELPDASLVSLVPISTRKPGDEASLGNQVEMARVSLRTDIAEPLERLAAIRESTRKLKERPESLGARALLDVSQLVPGLLMGTVNRSVARAVIGLGRSAGANTTVTNVPGPREPLYFAGARMVMLFAMVPVFNGAGLFHSVSSYVDDFMFSITADRDMLPDPSVYADCISASYEELLAAAS
jgi:WS/DGAT/MGAT family acyltransferase